MKRIFFTVTNDLTYDRRMQRICTSLAKHGYKVTLVGRQLPGSRPLRAESYHQKRIYCLFTKGKLFYGEYNTRLFFYLLFQKMDAICAIDLDTIIPCLRISKWKKIPRVYDAHEIFTEMKEVLSRPAIYKIWKQIEEYCVPRFKKGYTVSQPIAEEFRRRYAVNYEVIRNMPVLKDLSQVMPKEKFLLYQGAVNEARGFEYLIPAMKLVNCKLVICGDGNYMQQLQMLIRTHQVENKVELKGMLLPDDLWQVSQQAYIGIAIPEREGMNQYLALTNKFFDYIHAGLPQVTMNFPEYRKINQEYEVAVLLDEHAPNVIASAINNLLVNDVVYSRLKQNCLKARLVFNWQGEEKKLIAFYQSVINP
ncbi:MAG TPA: glycosyltransferase [Chitinophagaceae bacterium]